VDYRLLGPLEVLAGDRSAALGGPVQRAVLTVLLLRPNEVVSVDTLIDQVWGERPPAAATASLHNCVARLRRELGAETVKTRPPGYLRQARPEEIDALRFERAIAAARALEPAERAAALSEALSMWRGPALADLAFQPFAEGEAARLEELRLIALEERIEAELELGRHASLVAELEALVARHPLRERLRRAQLLALYRSRRKADALQAFQEARLALIDELGLEPSDELRALERRIHVDDPALELPLATTATGVAREIRRPAVVLCLEAEVADDPEPGRRMMAACAEAARAATERHGGSVQQLLGEEVVAFFGLPAAHEDDALRALRAAVDIREALDGLGAPARIALSAGDVLAVGDAAPHAGAALREGRRLKDRAAPGTILLAPSVLRLVGPAVDTVPADATGEAFRLLRVELDAPSPIRRFDTRLVGRESELAQLAAALDTVAEQRRSRRVVVIGDPGAGKSRLVRELGASVGADARMLVGRCVAYGEAARYAPIAEIVRTAIGPADPVPDELVPLLEAGTPTAPSPNVFRAVRRVLEAVGEPVVVALEDLHWAAPMLLDLVEYLVGWDGELPLLLVCTARPELLDVRPDWRREELVLEPLDETDARALARVLEPGLEETRLHAVLRAAEGNPLFIEQLLAAGDELDGLPPTLESLLASRLDRLPDPDREVLGDAAVAGREFWRSAVAALSSDASAVPSRLASLVRQRFLRPAVSSVAGEDAYVFHHALIRDAAYASLPKAARAELHERLARWLTKRPDTADDVIGFHLEQAHAYGLELGAEVDGLAQEAAGRLGQAGLAAFRRNDIREADDLLSRAVALLPPADEQRLALSCELATALKPTGDYERVEDILETTADLAARHGFDQIEQRARIELVWPQLLRGAGDVDESVRLVERILAALSPDGDERALERGHYCLAALRGRLQCKHEASEQAATEALRYSRLTGFLPTGPMSMLAADAYEGPRHVDEALSRCSALLAEATRSAEPGIRIALAQLLAMRGDISGARAELDLARRLRDEFGFTGAEPRDAAIAAAEVEVLAGDANAAEAVLRTALAALDAEGDDAWRATIGARLAELLVDLDRHAEALTVSEEAMKRAHGGDVRAQVAWRRARAEALAQAGRPGEGEALARQAIALLDSTDEVNEQAKAYSALAEVLRRAGRAEEASEAVSTAEELFASKGNEVLRRLRRRKRRRAP
jgi:DNA-binding SARP family transcriptional activator